MWDSSPEFRKKGPCPEGSRVRETSCPHPGLPREKRDLPTQGALQALARAPASPPHCEVLESTLHLRVPWQTRPRMPTLPRLVKFFWLVLGLLPLRAAAQPHAYTLEATLDPEAHVVRGTARITWTNESDRPIG